MSAILSIDEEKRILLIRFAGVVTDDSLVEDYRRVRAWFAIHGTWGNISDFTDVTCFEGTGRSIRVLASNPPLVPGNHVRILVAPQDEVYGLARMFEMMGSEMGNRVDIVRDLAEAYRLAGVTGTAFHEVDMPDAADD